jgi:hypothetical protein
VLVEKGLSPSKVDLVHTEVMQLFDQLQAFIFAQLFLIPIETLHNVAKLAFVVAGSFQMEIYCKELLLFVELID